MNWLGVKRDKIVILKHLPITKFKKFPQSPLVHDVTFELAELEFRKACLLYSALECDLPKIKNADLKERVSIDEGIITTTKAHRSSSQL